MGTHFSDLTPIPTPTGDDIIPISQLDNTNNRNTYKITLNQIKDFTTSNLVNNSNTSDYLYVDHLTGSQLSGGDVISYDSATQKFITHSNYRINEKFSNFDVTSDLVGSVVLITNNSNETNVTLRLNSVKTISKGARLTLIQEGNYSFNIVKDAGVEINYLDENNKFLNLNNNFNIKSKGKYSLVNLIKVGDNKWEIYGDITYGNLTINGSSLISKTIDDYDVYDIKDGYNIKILFDRNSLFFNSNSINSENHRNDIISACRKWSKALKNTSFPFIKQAYSAYDGGNLITNPLYNESFNGLVIIASSYYQDSEKLGFGGIWSRRSRQYSKQYLIPIQGYFRINEKYNSDHDIKNTDSNITGLYFLALHEIGHVLGIGSNWHLTFDGINLNRSFIVGANDTSKNIFNNTSMNLFYSLSTGNGSRPANNIGSIILDGRYFADANYKYAYNPYGIGINNSKAVYYYNQTFNTTVSAIPVENNMGAGSYAVHWYEGYGDTNVNPITGIDNRTYYGDLYGGAYAMRVELMSPESDLFDAPLSNISLGSLEDIGYGIDYTESDNYSPFTINIKYTSSDGSIYTKIGDFGGWLLSAIIRSGSIVQYPNVYPLRRGSTYTIKNATIDNFMITKVTADGSETELAVGTGTTPITLAINKSYNLTDKIYIKYGVPSGTSKIYFLLGG
jgi:hypothetical protein